MRPWSCGEGPAWTPAVARPEGPRDSRKAAHPTPLSLSQDPRDRAQDASHILVGRLLLLKLPATEPFGADITGARGSGVGAPHTLAGGDHKAFGEDANMAVTVALQPCLVHCKGDIQALSNVHSQKPQVHR